MPGSSLLAVAALIGVRTLLKICLSPKKETLRHEIIPISTSVFSGHSRVGLRLVE
jgi:hypothetical protein